MRALASNANPFLPWELWAGFVPTPIPLVQAVRIHFLLIELAQMARLVV